MKLTKKAALLLLLAQNASAEACMANIPALNELILDIQTIGNPIGFFMLAYMGVKWIVAEGPQDVENARRGVIYVVIGLILLKVSHPLVVYLLCF